MQLRFESQSFVATGAVSKWRVLRPADQTGQRCLLCGKSAMQLVLFEATSESQTRLILL